MLAEWSSVWVVQPVQPLPLSPQYAQMIEGACGPVAAAAAPQTASAPMTAKTRQAARTLLQLLVLDFMFSPSSLSVVLSVFSDGNGREELRTCLCQLRADSVTACTHTTTTARRCPLCPCPTSPRFALSS